MMVELLAKATLILTVVVLGSAILRRASAGARHCLQVLGLAAVLLLPALVIAVPAWEIAWLSPEPAELPAHDTPKPKPRVDPSLLAAFPGPVDTQVDVDPSAGSAGAARSPGSLGSDAECDCPPARPRELSKTPRESPFERDLATASLLPLATGQSWPGGPGDPAVWLVGLWALGTLLVATRLVVGWLRMTRLAIDASPLECARTWRQVGQCRRRLGLRSEPTVLLSPRLRVPLLWGIWRPILLLPLGATAWPDLRLRAVLLHELAHLRRRDGATLLLGRLATALWWFHPLAWWVDRGAGRDRERACDDLVLACGERPSDYATQLLALARQLPRRDTTPAATLAVVSPGHLEERVKAILYPGLRRGFGRRAACALTVVVGVGIVALASAQLVAKEPRRSTTDPIVISDLGSDLGLVFRVAPRVKTVVDTGDEGELYMLAHGDHDSAGELAWKRAYRLHKEERFEEAAQAFAEAYEAGYRPATSAYNAACGHARLEQTTEALRWLDLAFEAGFDHHELIAEDRDLDPIRRDAGFRSMLERESDRVRWHREPDRYEMALGLYEDLQDSGSTDGGDWYKAGSVLLSLRDFEHATDALERAAELLGDHNQSALYNLACARALSGETGSALDVLEQAVLAGFDSEERFRNDSDLRSIRDERRFAEIEQLRDALSMDRFRQRWNWGSDYSARRWAPAVEHFQEFVNERPDVGRAWHNLGYSLHYSRKHAEARAAFERQLALGYREATAEYNIACTYAMEENATAAIEWLERAVERGTVSVHQILGDEDLESLYEQTRFEALLDRAAEKDEDMRDRFEQRKRIEHWRDGRYGRSVRLF